MSTINETARGSLAEQPTTVEASPQRRQVVNAFNSAFVRFREETEPLKWKLTWNSYDRSLITEEEIEQVAGFNIVSDSVRLVMGNSDSLETNHPLSPSLPSYTYPVGFPYRSPHHVVEGELVLQEHIVITPLLRFLEQEQETLTEMVDDAERFGEDATQLVQALARTD